VIPSRMLLSVLVPTHNPAFEPLTRTLDGLRAQTLRPDQWELIVVDNASRTPLAGQLDLSWHPAARVVREEQLGLTSARLAGFAAARGAIIVLVDDDNVLAPDYLSQALALAAEYPRLGAWSGNVVLEFAPDAVPPPAAWRSNLTERKITQDKISNEREDHDSTPWGAGLCVRREVAQAYATELAGNPLRRELDLQGQTLLYGGDTDIAYVGCACGYSKGVFARLTLQHLIPAQRCTTAYLEKSMEGHAYSSVLHGFILGGPVPTYLTSPVWRAKAWLRRLLMSRDDRIQAACHARGATRAVHDIRRVQASSR
jgi:GT2 family glycosyltransferase